MITFSIKKLVFIFCFVFLFLALPSTADAQFLPFGGFVVNSFYCPCSNNFLLGISGPVGGQFIYQPGVPQYPFAQLPRPGVWALGLYTPVGICLVPASHGCNPVGTPIGRITSVVGTSM